MKLKLIPNILEKSNRVELDVECTGQTVESYFAEHFAGYTQKDFVPLVNGGQVEWDYIPCDTDDIIFANDIKGGGGGGILSFATLAVGIGLLFTPLWGYGVALIASTLISQLAASMFEVDMPDVSTSDFSGSKTYSWDGIQNIIGEGNIVPVVYGKHRVGGVVIEAFVDGDTATGLQENKYLNMLCAISEGEIEGIETGEIYVNSNEISSYDGVNYDYRLGLADQTPMPDFSVIAKHYTLSGVKLTKNNPYIYKTVDEVNYARTTLMFQALFATNNDGDLVEQTVQVKVEYKHKDESVYTTVGTYSVKNNTKSKVEYDIRVNFPSKGQYYIRLTRITDDFDTQTKQQGDSHFTAVTEAENAAVAYNNTALLGLRILATDQLSGSMPTVTAVVWGKKVRNVKRKYLYGDDTNHWSNNPADILYDIMTNKRYGLGRFISDEDIDLESMAAFSDWCDETITHSVYNPETGRYDTVTDKRYELNLVLDKQFSAIDLINKILGTCRAVPYWQGNKFKVVIEREGDPVQLFGMGNISNFEEEYVGLFDIPNQVEAKFLNEENEYKQATVSGFDSNRINEPVNSKSIQLYGLTKYAMVKREVMFALRKTVSLRKFATFEAGMDAVICELGDVVLISHDTPQYGYSGRLKEVKSDRVVLDREVEITQGREYSLRIRKDDNTFEVYRVVAEKSGSTNEVKINTASAAVKGDVYAFGEVNKEAKPYRVLSIQTASQGKVKIRVEEYIADVYSNDDSIEVERIDYSQLGIIERYELDGTADDPQPIKVADNPIVGVSYYDVPPYVDSVELTEKVEVVDGQVTSNIIINFTQVKMPDNSLARVDRYLIMTSSNSGMTWEEVGYARGNFYEIRNVKRDTAYYVVVKPYTNFNVTNDAEKSDSRFKFSITPTGKVPVPDDVQNFVVIQNGGMLQFRWDAVTNTAIDSYEVRLESWEFGKRVGVTKDTNMNSVVTKAGTLKFLIKARNLHGEYSLSATEYSIVVSDGEQRNVVFVHDDMAEGWTGVKRGTEVNIAGELALADGANEGEYITGYVDLLEPVRSRNIVDYTINAYMNGEDVWDETEYTWDSEEANILWESIVDRENIAYGHFVSTYVALGEEFVDVIRLMGDTTSVNGVSPTVESNITYGEGTLHQGVNLDDFTQLEYPLSVGSNFSILLRLKVGNTLSSGMVFRLSDGDSELQIIAIENGFFLLSDGSNIIQAKVPFAPGDNLIFGVGFDGTVHQFFVGNTTTKTADSGTYTLNFGTPTNLII